MTERDEKGRFANGNRGGPGRPKKSVEEKYLDILISVCTAEDWAKVVGVAVSRAKAGDAKAREWLGYYIIGKPVERHEVTGAEGGPVVVEYDIDAATVAEAINVLGGANGCPGCGGP